MGGPPKEGNGSSAGNTGDARLHVEVGGVELDLELGRQDGRGRARTRDPSKDVLSSVKCIFASVNNKRFVNFLYSTLPTFDFST